MSHLNGTRPPPGQVGNPRRFLEFQHRLANVRALGVRAECPGVVNNQSNELSRVCEKRFLFLEHHVGRVGRLKPFGFG